MKAYPPHPHSSEDMELRIQSPCAKVDLGRDRISRSLPVFCDHDKITGTLHLASKVASMPGRLTITVSMDMICSVCLSELTLYAIPLDGRHFHVYFLEDRR